VVVRDGLDLGRDQRPDPDFQRLDLVAASRDVPLAVAEVKLRLARDARRVVGELDAVVTGELEAIRVTRLSHLSSYRLSEGRVVRFVQRRP
jgi:hypothetical protein